MADGGCGRPELKWADVGIVCRWGIMAHGRGNVCQFQAVGFPLLKSGKNEQLCPVINSLLTNQGEYVTDSLQQMEVGCGLSKVATLDQKAKP